MNNVLDCLRGMRCAVEPCGSRWTCDPPPMNTDEDYLVEVPTRIAEWADSYLSSVGFSPEGDASYSGTSEFTSWRLGQVNLIVTSNSAFADRWRTATKLAKRFNLLDKIDRIALFQAVLYGADYLVQPKRPWWAFWR